MDDSDDYIVDDIALDDETLALLDREEQKYLSSQTNLFADAPPVNKKRKTDSGWKPGLVHRWDNPDNFEDLPDVSVQDDGTYRVRDDNEGTPTRPDPLSNRSFGTDNRRNTTRAASATPALPRTDGAIEADNAQQRANYSEQRNIPIRQHSHPSAEGSVQGVPLEKRVQELQQSMRELSAENQRMQSTLKQAIDARLMKDGEVTILRKGIEKTAQEHAGQIAKLKFAKEEADAKQVQIQKEMKEEIERIKTQFIFKQQELESSLRRAPPSARAKKTYEDPLRTPIRRFSQNAVRDTPVANNFLTRQVQPFNTQHAETPRLRRTLKSPRNQNVAGALPGFHNTFVTPLVVRPRADILHSKDHPRSSPVPDSPPSSPTRHGIINPFDHDSSIRPMPSAGERQTNAAAENVTDSMIVEEEDVQDPEETAYQPVNWISELSRISLTHTLPGSLQPTLQSLMTTSPATKEADLTSFVAAGSEILRTIANLHAIQGYTNAMRHLCGPLTTMLFIIGKSKQYTSIRSLINLLTALTFSIPDFGTHLLNHADGDTHSPCVGAICDIIIRDLAVANRFEWFDSLAHEVLSFLEAACLRAQEDAIARLAPLVVDGQVLATLLHSAQPEWLLDRVCRLLIYFGSHQVLARGLLNGQSAPVIGRGEPTDPGETLIIDRLCTLLSESKEPVKTMNDHILTFIATLSVSQPESLTTLINNDYLIPSLVCFLSTLTSPLWEDENSVSSPDLATLIHTTTQTITLIHHLVFAAGPSFNLRLRLHHNQRRALTGLHHMFIVSCGRLSFADPPAYAGNNGRHELELVSDLARELLDLVVDGPESDSIWSLYQEDPDQNGSETDEGEIEARLLGG